MSGRSFHEMCDKLDDALVPTCGWVLRRRRGADRSPWRVELGREDPDGIRLDGEGSTPEAAIEAALRALHAAAQRTCAEAEQKAREARDALDQVMRAETK